MQQAALVTAGQLFTQRRGRGDEEVLQGCVGLGAGAHRTETSDSQHAHHLRGVVGAFRLAQGFAGQHDRGGSGRISVIGFAVAGTALPFGTADL